MMGERQVYMKRKPGTRCTLGREYSRVVSAEPCICTLYDFEWWVTCTHTHTCTHTETQSSCFSNGGNEWQWLLRIKGPSVACREQKLQGSNQLYRLIKWHLNVKKQGFSLHLSGVFFQSSLWYCCSRYIKLACSWGGKVKTWFYISLS